MLGMIRTDCLGVSGTCNVQQPASGRRIANLRVFGPFPVYTALVSKCRPQQQQTASQLSFESQNLPCTSRKRRRGLSMSRNSNAHPRTTNRSNHSPPKLSICSILYSSDSQHSKIRRRKNLRSLNGAWWGRTGFLLGLPLHHIIFTSLRPLTAICPCTCVGPQTTCIIIV